MPLHKMHSLEHLVERHTGMLEHSAYLHGELLAALAALLEAVANHTLGALHARLGADASQIIDTAADHATVRANHPLRPNDALQIPESLGFIVEVRGRKNRHGEVLR